MSEAIDWTAMNPMLCDTCISGCGYRWPTASNDRDDHMYVERCDNCRRFDCDDEAAEYVLARLNDEFHVAKVNDDEVKPGRPSGIVVEVGMADVGGIHPQPYIDILDGKGRVFGGRIL